MRRKCPLLNSSSVRFRTVGAMAVNFANSVRWEIYALRSLLRLPLLKSLRALLGLALLVFSPIAKV